MKPKNVEVNCLCCGNKVITSLDVVEKTPLCIKCIDIFETKNANLHRESDRLNDELENLKEAYGGENAKLKQELEYFTNKVDWQKMYNLEKITKLDYLGKWNTAKLELSEAKVESKKWEYNCRLNREETNSFEDKNNKLKEKLAKATERADKYKCDFIQKRNELVLKDKALVDACTNKLFRCSTCDVKGCRAGRDNKYECIKTQMDYYKERAREK